MHKAITVMLYWRGCISFIYPQQYSFSVVQSIKIKLRNNKNQNHLVSVQVELNPKDNKYEKLPT